MAWRRSGDKQLYEPMMTYGVTPPRRIKHLKLKHLNIIRNLPEVIVVKHTACCSHKYSVHEAFM